LYELLVIPACKDINKNDWNKPYFEDK